MFWGFPELAEQPGADPRDNSQTRQATASADPGHLHRHRSQMPASGTLRLTFAILISHALLMEASRLKKRTGAEGRGPPWTHSASLADRPWQVEADGCCSCHHPPAGASGNSPGRKMRNEAANGERA